MAAGLSGCLGSSSGNPLIDDGTQGTPTGGGSGTGGSGSSGGSGGSGSSKITLEGYGAKIYGKADIDSQGNITRFTQGPSTHGPADLKAELTTDSNGDVSEITANYANGNKKYTYNKSNTDTFNVNENDGNIEKYGHSSLAYGTGNGTYKYLAVSDWESDASAGSTNQDVWMIKGVAGEKTQTMPSSGLAHYDGRVIIDGGKTDAKGNVSDTPSIEGDSHFTADFSSAKVTGGFNNFKDDDGKDLTGAINLPASGASIAGNAFQGNLSGNIAGDTVTGKLKGGFFGPNAAEMGCAMTLQSQSGYKGVGAFAAKKQLHRRFRGAAGRSRRLAGAGEEGLRPSCLQHSVHAGLFAPPAVRKEVCASQANSGLRSPCQQHLQAGMARDKATGAASPSRRIWSGWADMGGRVNLLLIICARGLYTHLSWRNK